MWSGVLGLKLWQVFKDNYSGWSRMLFLVWWLFCMFIFGLELVPLLLSPIVHSQLYDCYNLYKLALKIKYVWYLRRIYLCLYRILKYVLSPNLCFLFALRQKYCKAPCYIWKGWLIPLALWFGKDVLTSFCQFIMIYKGKIALIATMDLHMHVNMIIKFYLAKNRPLILSLSHLISKMLRLVMLSFSACYFVFLGQDMWSGIHKDWIL